MVITTDTLNEGIHFRADCLPEFLGHKALAISLSDLAAMGATPLWATINLSIPNVEHQWLKDFAHGLFSLADRYDVKIIGGDTAKGYLSISVQAIGCLGPGEMLTRSGAEVDDLIYVSGTIGDAALGLKLYECMQGTVSPVDQDYLTLRFDKPEPRIELGLEIVKFAKAATDVSDGLLIDLQHVLSMSNVGAVIDTGKIPFSEAIQRQLKDSQDWSTLLTGGEDYELIFTADKRYADRVRHISDKINCPITEIGQIVEGNNIKLMQEGSPVALPEKLGFDHFA